MKLNTRCLPLGALPYENIDTAARMIAKLFEKSPYLPVLPLLDNNDTILQRTLHNIPGIKIKDSKVIVKTSTNSYKQGLVKLDKAFNDPKIENLEPYAIESVFLEKFFQLIKKFKSPHACINLLGPFTLSQIIKNSIEEQTLTDKSFRKLFIQAVCVKALWMINKIKEINSNTVPIVILEEPLFYTLGDIKREDEEITVELVTHLFTRTIETLKAAGAIVAVQSKEKCDWKIPINAGVDIISFDAYNNPNNLCIIPDNITEFIARGGKINWGIIPVASESIVKSLNIDYITNRLFATMEGLIIAGVSEKLVYNSALVSVQNDVDKLPLIFAEKALILSTQVAGRIPIKG